MIELYVNGQHIELAPGEEITGGKSCMYPGELSTRTGLITADFDIARTAGNDAVLGADFSQKTDSELRADGQVSRGYVQIVGRDRFNYRVAFFGDNADWYDKIKGQSLQDLDLTDWAHTYTYADISDSWTTETLYVYPLLNYGRLSELLGLATDITDYFPAVYEYALVREIFQQAGWKVAGDVLKNWRYLNTCVPFTNAAFQVSLDYASRFIANARGYAQSYNYTASNVAISGTQTQAIDIAVAERDIFNAFNLAANTYTAPVAVVATFDVTLAQTGVNLQCSSPDTSGTVVSANVLVKVNGTTVATHTLLSSTFTTTGTTFTANTFVFSDTLTLDAGDVVSWELAYIWSNAQAGVTDLTLNLTNVNPTINLTSIDRNIIPGGAVTIENNLPDIAQEDYITDVLIRYGLIIHTDSRTKTVYLNQFENLAGKLPAAPDWSGYISPDFRLDYTTAVQQYAQNTLFGYAESSEKDIPTDVYKGENRYPLGWGGMSVDNEFLPGQQTYYVSPFAPSSTVQYRAIPTSAAYYLTYIPHYITGEDAELDEPDDTPRLVIVVRGADVDGFKADTLGLPLGEVSITDEDGVLHTTSTIPWAWFSKGYMQAQNDSLNDFTDSLAFAPQQLTGTQEIGILAESYQLLQAAINRGEVYSVYARLPIYLFSGLDFSQPIYLRYGEVVGYFFIVAVSEFQAGEFAQLQLLKIA